MAALAGMVDLRNSTRDDMYMAQTLGQGLGEAFAGFQNNKENERLREAEQRRQATDAEIVRIAHQASVDGWDNTKTLQELMNVPGYMQSRFAAQQAQQQLTMKPQGSEFNKLPWYMNPEYADTPQARIAGGVDPRASAATATADNPIVRTDGEGNPVQYNRETGQWETPPGMKPKPKPAEQVDPVKVLDAISETDQQIAQRKAMLDGGTGPDGEPLTDEQRRGIEMDLATLRQKAGILNQRAPEDVRNARETAQRSIDRMGVVKRIAAENPLADRMDRIKETKKAGKLDKIKDPDEIRRVLTGYAQELRQKGLTAPEAQAEAERQYRLIVEANGPNALGFRQYPDEEMHVPANQLTMNQGYTDPATDAAPAYVREMMARQGVSPAPAAQPAPARQQATPPPPAPELAPIWDALSPEGQAEVMQAIQQGYSPAQIMAYLNKGMK